MNTTQEGEREGSIGWKRLGTWVEIGTWMEIDTDQYYSKGSKRDEKVSRNWDSWEGVQ